MIVKVFDNEGNEIGVCSNYDVRSKEEPIQDLSLKRVPPQPEISLVLWDWKTPTPVIPIPPLVDAERKIVEDAMGYLIWMLGGRVELNMPQILEMMKSKQTLSNQVSLDLLVLEVVDK